MKTLSMAILFCVTVLGASVQQNTFTTNRVSPGIGLTNVITGTNAVVAGTNLITELRLDIAAGAGITLTTNGTQVSFSAVGAGLGDVSGPGAATNAAVVIFDGVTGKAIKDSGVLISTLVAGGGGAPANTVVGPGAAVTSGRLASWSGTTGTNIADSGYSATSFATSAHTHAQLHDRAHGVTSASDHSDWPATVDLTELGYLDGVTSAIQSQLNGKQASGAYLTEASAYSLYQGTNSNLTLWSALAPSAKQDADADLLQLGTITWASGDVLYRTANSLTNLAKGVDGQVLKLSGGFPSWGTDNTGVGGSGDDVWLNHADVTNPNITNSLAVTWTLAVDGTNITATVTEYGATNAIGYIPQQQAATLTALSTNTITGDGRIILESFAQPADAQLDEWATVSTNSVTALGVGALTATTVDIGTTNVITAINGKAPNTFAGITNALGYFPTTNTFAGITNALGYFPLTNTFAGVTNALGYFPVTNTFDGITNALGFFPLTNTFDAITNALNFQPMTNSFLAVTNALGYEPQPEDDQLYEWAAQGTNDVYLGSVTIGTTNVVTALAAKIGTRTGVPREIWIPASAMNPSAASPAAGSTNAWATTTDGQTIETYDFDSATDESVQFTLPLPLAWNASTVKAKFFWKQVTASAATNVWGIVAGSLADDEIGGNTLGTAVTLQDVGLNDTNKVAITAVTGALTIGGTPSAGHFLWFKVYRDADAAEDNMSGDARLIGVHLQYTESATEPTAW